MDLGESIEFDEQVKQQIVDVKRPSRERKQPKRYSPPKFCSYFALYSIEYDRKSANKEIELTQGKLWKRAMDKEFESLKNN